MAMGQWPMQNAARPGTARPPVLGKGDSHGRGGARRVWVRVWEPLPPGGRRDFRSHENSFCGRRCTRSFFDGCCLGSGIEGLISQGFGEGLWVVSDMCSAKKAAVWAFVPKGGSFYSSAKDRPRCLPGSNELVRMRVCSWCGRHGAADRRANGCWPRWGGWSICRWAGSWRDCCGA